MLFTTSWDDGHPADRRLGDLLARHGMPGTFYCPLSNVEGLPVMVAAELRALEPEFEIGSHTLDHVYLGSVPVDQWQRQVVQGKAALEQALGHRVAGFCYPGGVMNAVARRMVAEAGFDYARTIRNLFPNCGSNAFTMPTSIQFYPHRRSVILRNFVRAGAWSSRARLAAAALSTDDLEERLQLLLQVFLTRSGVFHLWGHSWEIDRFNLWDVLDRFLAEVARQVPAADRLSNAATWQARGLLR